MQKSPTQQNRIPHPSTTTGKDLIVVLEGWLQRHDQDAEFGESAAIGGAERTARGRAERGRCRHKRSMPLSMNEKVAPPSRVRVRLKSKESNDQECQEKSRRKRWNSAVRRTKVVKLKGWVCCNGNASGEDLQIVYGTVNDVLYRLPIRNNAAVTRLCAGR